MEMNTPYLPFFGFEKEPFTADIAVKDILETDQLAASKNRFDYTLGLGAIYLITGEIGSGKSTAIRYLVNALHPSEYKLIYVTATSGSILELYRLIIGELGMKPAGTSRAVMTERIKREVLELIHSKKQTVVLVIDEASLLRLEVFVELHTLCQFEMDSKPYLPIVLAGQTHLIDNLRYPGCLPLASRVVAKSHFKIRLHRFQKRTDANVSSTSSEHCRDRPDAVRRRCHHGHPPRIGRHLQKSQPSGSRCPGCRGHGS